MAVALARRAAVENNREQMVALNLVPTRRQAKSAKKSYRTLARREQPDCMLNMGAPVGHKVIAPRDALTVKHFAAHESRKNAGWLRG